MLAKYQLMNRFWFHEHLPLTSTFWFTYYLYNSAMATTQFNLSIFKKSFYLWYFIQICVKSYPEKYWFFQKLELSVSEKSEANWFKTVLHLSEHVHFYSENCDSILCKLVDFLAYKIEGLGKFSYKNHFAWYGCRTMVIQTNMRNR